MSFGLGAWHETTPITSAAAEAKYQSAHEGNGGGAEPHPDTVAFMEELLERWPSAEAREAASDPRWEDSPWSEPPGLVDDLVDMQLGWSRVKDMLGPIRDAAERHGLVLYDPQVGVVHYPPALAALPHRRVELEDGSVHDDPSEEQLTGLLASLGDRSTYLILETAAQNYLQTRIHDGHFDAEYRDGGPETHFEAGGLDLATVTALFVDYLGGGNRWRSQVTWRKLDLG